MNRTTRARPEWERVSRSRLRQQQSAVLKKALGRRVVVVTAHGRRAEKCVLDKAYLEELFGRIETLRETLEVAADTRLFPRLLRAAKTVDRDARRGRLHSFAEAFGKE